MGMTDEHKSPDMVKYDEVISIIANNPKCFASEEKMASILRQISNLRKHDLKPIADNITNNNTTFNVIAEKGKVKELVDTIKDNVGW